MAPSINLYNKNAYRKALKGDDNRATYLATANGAQTLAASDASLDRIVLIIIKVLTTFADGTGGQPTFAFGETSSTTKFGGTSLLTAAVAGQVFVLAGKLSSTKDLLVTAVAATGTGAGAIEVCAAVFPSTY